MVLNLRIKINPAIIMHTTFTLRRETCTSILIFGSVVHQTDKIRYLGLHIERHLTWNAYIDTKRKSLGNR